jgi:hypothetical protein
VGKAKSEKKFDGQEKKQPDFNQDLFEEKKSSIDEIESDGSGSAFKETENVNEDNFDHLSEK